MFRSVDGLGAELDVPVFGAPSLASVSRDGRIVVWASTFGLGRSKIIRRRALFRTLMVLGGSMLSFTVLIRVLSGRRIVFSKL